MLCGKCNTEMVEKFEVRKGVKVPVYTCPKCSKELIDYGKALQARRREITERKNKELNGIKGSVRRMRARRKKPIVSNPKGEITVV